jgi:hypothetical protein
MVAISYGEYGKSDVEKKKKKKKREDFSEEALKRRLSSRKNSY